MIALKILSGVVTAALLFGAVAIGGGTPIAPAEIAAAASDAVENVTEAAENTAAAARDTAALAEIADNVRSQVETSERLLRVQLRLEESSRSGAARSRVLGAGISDVAAGLRELRARLARLSALSERSGDVTESSATAAAALERALNELEARFDVLIAQSRRLNKKAHGFDELTDFPP